MAVPATKPIHVGIYARKSRFVESSESVASQVAMCREHVERAFPGCTVTVYDGDEGYSGGNTNRPSFQRMLEDIRARKISVVCCYRLDRISRSIRDFCALLDDLQHYDVAFVSIRENFDTSTPMGRAMLLIASIFSQLERETIAERVRDSLYAMAKTGRWLGGNPPTGYTAVPVSFQDGGVTRRFFMLEPVPDELEQVQLLFRQFASIGSLSGLVSYCLRNGIRSRNGVEYSRTTLRTLLTNPVYCTADADAWRYFSDGPFDLAASADDFDGICGLMPYNRTCKQDARTLHKDFSDWIIAPARHAGAVPGALWVQAQQIFEQNKTRGRGFQAPRTEAALLSGIIRCGHCGSFMRPKVYGKPLPDGSRRFHYQCWKKLESRGDLCSMKNAPFDVDAIVVEHLRTLSEKYSSLSGDSAPILAGAAARSVDDSIRTANAEIQAAQRQLDNLTASIADGAPAAALQVIFAKIDELSALISAKQAALEELEAARLSLSGEAALMQHVASLLSSFGDAFSTLTHAEKRRILRCVVDCVTWDGDSLTIDVLGGKTLPG